MKPPIPSPLPEPREVRAVTKRIEWDEAEQCFFLVYTSSVLQRLRCEWNACYSRPWNFLGLIIGLPIVVLIMAYGSVTSKRRPNQLCIFSWGIRDICSDKSGQMTWEEIKGISNRDGDIYILRAWYQAGAYFVREAFRDGEESCRLEAMLRTLWESKGGSWLEMKAQFETQV